MKFSKNFRMKHGTDDLILLVIRSTVLIQAFLKKYILSTAIYCFHPCRPNGWVGGRRQQKFVHVESQKL